MKEANKYWLDENKKLFILW